MTEVLDQGIVCGTFLRNPDNGRTNISATNRLRIGDHVIDQPVNDLDVADPRWVEFIGQFNAAAVAERDSLEQQLASAIEARNEAEAQLGSAIRERDAALWRLDGALSEVLRLQEQLNPPVGSTLMYPAVFRKLFTREERAAIRRIENDDLEEAKEELFTVKMVDRQDPDTIRYVMALVAIGVITQSRADRILAGLPPE